MSELDTPRFRAWLERAWSEVSQSRAQLNAENLYPVADSDTGSNLEATLEAAVTAMRAEDSEELGDVADAAARGALGGAQGNSGVILSQIFRGFADGIREGLPQAFARAHEAAQKAVTNPKEGTILTAARAARDAVALRVGEMTTPNMTAVFLKSGFHSDLTLKETFHQFPAKVSSKTKMEVVSGNLSLSIHTTQKEKYLLVTGTVSSSTPSLQESIFSLMPRTQEYLLKELLKHTVNESMLIHK